MASLQPTTPQLRLLKPLKTLNLRCGGPGLLLDSEAPDIAQREIGTLGNLRYLYVSGNFNFTDKEATNLSKLMVLEEVYLDCQNMRDATFHALSNCPNLVSLVTYAEASDMGFESIGKMPKLETLSLNSTCTSTGFRELAKLKNLKTLGITGGTVDGPTLVSTLAALPKLETLWMRVSGPKDADIADLVRKTKLTTFSPHSCPVADETFRAVKENKTLKTLSIDAYYLSEVEANAIRAARPELTLIANK